MAVSSAGDSILQHSSGSCVLFIPYSSLFPETCVGRRGIERPPLGLSIHWYWEVAPRAIDVSPVSTADLCISRPAFLCKVTLVSSHSRKRVTLLIPFYFIVLKLVS